KMNNSGVGWTSDLNLLTENNITYDRNGNIQSLDRYTGTVSSVKIDQLVYTYGSGGNQLMRVTDNAPAVPTGLERGFEDGNTGSDDYGYDVNGNVIKDLNKGIETITYNLLDLPARVTFTDDSYI